MENILARDLHLCILYGTNIHRIKYHLLVKKASSANKLALYYNHTVMPIAQKQFETSFALSTKSHLLSWPRALHILT